MTIYTTENPNIPAEFLATSIIRQLDLGNRVLWFVTGGSSVAVGIEAAKLIAAHPHENLVVMLTDERYGVLEHKDSNWHKLAAGGFSLPGAQLIPILTGDARDITVEKFNNELAQEFSKADFKIGLFGIGADGHTGGILPNSDAAKSIDWAVGYNTEQFDRITVTPATIKKFDEIVGFAQGQEKWKVIEELETKDLDIVEQPAQALKKVPLFTLFTNYTSQK